jgi:hypothetical protein
MCHNPPSTESELRNVAWRDLAVSKFDNNSGACRCNPACWAYRGSAGALPQQFIWACLSHESSASQTSLA